MPACSRPKGRAGRKELQQRAELRAGFQAKHSLQIVAVHKLGQCRHRGLRLAFGQDFLGRAKAGIDAPGLSRLLNRIPRSGNWKKYY